jgi:putative transposase
VPYWQAYYHVTWSTEKRRHLLTPEMGVRLFSVVRTVAHRHRAVLHAAGATPDHIHLVLSVPPTVAVAQLLGELKGATSHLANHELGFDGSFAWNPGYGLLTVSPRQLPRVIDYVQSQKANHAHGTSVPSYERTER